MCHTFPEMPEKRNPLISDHKPCPGNELANAIIMIENMQHYYMRPHRDLKWGRQTGSWSVTTESIKVALKSVTAIRRQSDKTERLWLNVELPVTIKKSLHNPFAFICITNVFKVCISLACLQPQHTLLWSNVSAGDVLCWQNIFLVGSQKCSCSPNHRRLQR